MNNVNKTLYIPLYGKAYVSKKNIILQDKKAEEIWEQIEFLLKGKSKTKWLAYYMAMRAAKISKYKNPINDVGVTRVYGYDNLQELALKTGLIFEKEYDMTPQKYVDELHGIEKKTFRKLYAGKIAKSLYRMYEFR